MVVYSYSKISTFEKCPLKFKFQYLDKVKPEVKSFIEGFLGNKVHKVLEWIYKKVKRGEIPSLDEVLTFYYHEWKKDFSEDVKIVKEEHDEKFYFNKGLKFILDYYSKHKPFKDNTVAVEKKILIDLDSEYKLQGYIDRLVYDKEKGLIEIHDYKTGNFIGTQEDLDKDRQLALYSLGVKDMFDNIREINLVWHFLAVDREMRSKRNFEELEALKTEILELIKKIEATKVYPPSLGIFCNWCEFKNYCENYRRFEI